MSKPVQAGDRAYLSVIVERVLPTAFLVRLEGTEVVLRMETLLRRREGQGFLETVHLPCHLDTDGDGNCPIHSDCATQTLRRGPRPTQTILDEEPKV